VEKGVGIKALIVGLGSIGRRHLKNLRTLQPGAHITVWHQYANKDNSSEADGEERVVYKEEDALATEPDLALITSPASRHIETALTLARQGVHLFIEKPLSNNMEHIDELLEICRKNNLALTVGYNLRFYEPLQVMHKVLKDYRIGRILSFHAKVGQYLPDWRPESDYRTGVSANQALGGGVVLELSHELDYARWLVGEIKSVSAELGHISDLEIDVEDLAEINLRFENGAIGSIHLNMIQRPPMRGCRIIGSNGMITWDGLNNNVKLFSNSSNSWSNLYPAALLDRNEMYLKELRHFLDCFKGKGMPIITGKDGKRVLEIAVAIKQSSREQRRIAI